MQVITYCDYGTSEVLHLETIEKPVPADNQVLVRVHAASVNPLDWHFMRGTPYFMRTMSGLRRPGVTRLGVDFSGTVEAAGKDVKRFKPGDDLFGTRTGAFGQYIVVREEGAVALKPAAVSFEQAAAVPVAGITALQALRDKGHLKAGEKVLINGASGGVGTFMVQIARSFDAHVTGVCSGRNAEMVRSLGAEKVIDYTREDFTTTGEHYDLIVDNVGTRPLNEVRRALTPQGRLVLVGGGGPNDGKWLGPMWNVIDAAVLDPFVSQEVGMMMAETTPPDLAFLGDLIAQGKLTPVIDRTYPLGDLPKAIDYLEAGHAHGKVIITVE
ncbi:MAG TPA: NAD(P)-dependent alcohol dehydrogenase [Candidatus Polarisedimenticolia bacterium]|nr:NAD(P)-dependent alcohol dehydrogenase [Candidatus Polarisedimenticolia bacterium]